MTFFNFLLLAWGQQFWLLSTILCRKCILFFCSIDHPLGAVLVSAAEISKIVVEIWSVIALSVDSYYIILFSLDFVLAHHLHHVLHPYYVSLAFV